MTDDGPAARTVRLSSLDRRCVQTTKTPFSVSGFRNGGDGGGDEGGRSDGRLDDGFLRGKSGQAGGRVDGATGAGGAPATATLLRPASAARPPQPTLLLEQAGNRERESALTRFTTCTATAARLRQCANVAKQTHSKTPELVWAHGFYFNVIRACEENLALIF